jgi:predicted dehydrogenase
MIRTPVGIGLMGCGRIAESVHVPIVTRLATARLVAAADTSAERRAWLGRHVRDAAHATGNHCSGSERGSGDHGTPTCFHAEASCAAFTAGKHVL